MAEYLPAPAIESKYETELNEFCDNLVQESSSARAEIEKSWEDNLNFGRGKQWPTEIPEHRVDFVMNIISSTVRRKAAKLTDTKPTFEVTPRSDPALKAAAEVLTTVIRGIWDERSLMDSLTYGLYVEQIFGSCPFNVLWDKDLLYGLGDIDVRPWDTRHFLLDPAVTRASQMQRQAEYMILEDVVSLNLLLSEFGKAAVSEIAPDPRYSTFAQTRQGSSGFLSFVGSMFARPFQKNADRGKGSVIQRTVRQEFWLRDRRRMRDLPESLAKEFTAYVTFMHERYPLSTQYRERGPDDFVFNGGIRHILRAGKKILWEEGNPYWDAVMPIDMMSWGMEIEHPWGRPEVEDLKKIQLVINKLGGVITENAINVSNGAWIADANALTEKDWGILSSGKPNVTIKKRQGTEVRREPAPALPGSSFATMQFLVNAIDLLTGLTEPSRGAMPAAGASGISIECVDPETECLTKRGWKHYWELLPEDEIYTLNRETERGEWSSILKLNVQEQYEGPMYRITAKNVNALVTPDHGWWVQDYQQEGWQQRTVETWNSRHTIPLGARTAHEQDAPYSDAYVELLGWVFTEGSYNQVGWGHGRYRTIALCQSSKFPEDCQRIRGCLTACGLRSREYVDERNGALHWILSLPHAQPIIEQFPDKRPGYTFLSSLSARQLRILVDTMLRGDGRRFGLDRPHDRVSIEYFSADQELTDQFQCAACLAGYGTSQRESKCGEGGFFTGTHRHERYGELRAVTCKTLKVCSVRGLQDEHCITKEHYSGPIWCPTTKTGTWLARRGGRTYITSNSLQLAANELIRLQAREMEGFIARVGQKLISRVLQYYSSNRLLNIFGPDGRILSFEFIRDEFIQKLRGKNPEHVWREMEFSVKEGSSLSITKMQDSLLKINLYNMGLMSGKEVLKSLSIPDPEGTLEEARADVAARNAPQPVPIRQGGGAQRIPASFPATGQE